MNTFVSITAPKDKMSKGMLTSSLSFLHPMVVIRNDDRYIDFKLFGCSSKEQLDEKLLTLAETSSVDFKYVYAFV